MSVFHVFALLFIIVFIFIFPAMQRKALERHKQAEKDRVRQPVPKVVSKPLPPPPPSFHEVPLTERLLDEDFAFRTTIEDRKTKSSVEERELKIHVRPQFRETVNSSSFISTKPKAKKRKKQRSLKKMVISSEILKAPRALRGYDDT
jgi:hypothetical protein